MARYTDTLRDPFLRPVSGALVSVVDIFGNAATLTDDDDQPLDNPFYTDSYGNYVFNTSTGIYTVGFNYGGRLVFRETVAVGTLIANLTPDPANAGKYLALDADGVATYSSGTGADGALRTDLAVDGGQIVGVDGATLTDRLAEIDTDVDAVQDNVGIVSEALERVASPAPLTWPPARVFDFTRFVEGERVNELKTYGSPTAAINAAGQLQVSGTDWNDATKRVFLRDVTAAEGIIRFRILRGPFFVFITDPDTTIRRALWSGGTNLEVGVIDAANDVVSADSTPGTLAGVDGNEIYVEIKTGATVEGAAVEARSWKVGDARPSTPTTSGVYTSAVDGKEVNEGYISFANASGSTTKVLSVEIIDGKGGAPVTGSAAFEGLWFPVFEGAQICMCTVRGGDSMRMLAQGTTDIALEYAGVLGVVSGMEPVADIFVNGVRTGSPVTFSDADVAGRHGLFLGLSLDSTGPVSQVEVRFRGIHEANDKWLSRGGIAIYRANASTAGGVVSPWRDERPAMLGIGDSTLETILARGTPSSPSNSAGDVSWLRLVCDDVGYKPLHNGFGGTGLLTAGSGAMVDARSNARYYMKGRKFDFEAINAKKIIFDHGVNDFGAGVSASDWKNAARTFVLQCLRDYPGLEHFVFLPSFKNQYYMTQMQELVTEFADSRIVLCNTTGWAVTYLVPGDVHPDLASQSVIASNLATFLRALPAPSYS